MSKGASVDLASFPYATELVTNRRGSVSKVVLRLRDYQVLLEALEDAGLHRAMKQVAREKPLDRQSALALLDRR